MKQTDLFSMHPMAWAHAQAILNQEIEMLKQGASKEQRIEFLRDESSRLIRQSEITLIDSMNRVFADLSRSDVIHGLDDMRNRFLSYGFSGTLRSIRNQQRAMGIENTGLDAVSVQCAIAVLEHDEEFIYTLKRVYLPFIETVLDSKEVASVQPALVELDQQHMLMSEKERQAVSLISEALKKFDIQQLSFDDLDVHDLAYLRGRMLDVQIADMLSILVSRLGTSVLAQFLNATRETQVEIYANVLRTLIDDRLRELRAPTLSGSYEAQEHSLPVELGLFDAKGNHKNKTQLPELLTIAEAMDYLQVSRTTVFVLRKSGALEFRNVGSSVRITRESVLRYLDIESNDS